MENTSWSEIEKRNKAALVCYIITIAVISLAYLLEVFKGNRTVVYFIVDFLLMWVPGVLALVTNKMDGMQEKVKYIILFGFVIPWGFMLFTASNNLVFTYALVLMIGLNAYANRNFALITAIVFNVVNVAGVIYIFVATETDSEDVVSAEIQILLLLLCGFFNVFIAKTGVIINTEKLQELNDEKNHTANILNQVMNVSAELTTGIEDVT